MPSKSRKSVSSSRQVKSAKVVSSAKPHGSATRASHAAFVPLLVFCFLIWLIYRMLFRFPVWFDETVGKALFFALPVWLYISMTGDKSIVDTLRPSKLRPGLLLGLAVGGAYGFALSLLSIVRTGSQVMFVPLFSSPDFWGEFLLALATGFWETLFFYSWIMVVMQQKMTNWPLFKQLVVVAGIFLVFHIPNIALRTGWLSVLSIGPLLFIFALGQALLFVRNRNAYALIISQAVWGMALLIHFR